MQIPVQPGALWAVVDNVRFSPVPGFDAALGVDLLGNGTGTVTSSPAGIDCGSACDALFGTGTTVDLTATSATGSFFGGWGGSCSGSAATTSITLAGGALCSATFHLLAESADLVTSAAKTSGTARVGNRISHRVTVGNHGPATAHAATLVVTFSGLAAGDAATIRARGCSVAGVTISCALGDLASGASVKKTITVLPSTPGTIGLGATATSSTPDPDPANSSAVLTTVVR